MATFGCCRFWSMLSTYVRSIFFQNTKNMLFNALSTQAMGLSLKDFPISSLPSSSIYTHCNTLVLCKEVGNHCVFTNSTGVIWLEQIPCRSVVSKSKINILHEENILNQKAISHSMKTFSMTCKSPCTKMWTYQISFSKIDRLKSKNIILHQTKLQASQNKMYNMSQIKQKFQYTIHVPALFVRCLRSVLPGGEGAIRPRHQNILRRCKRRCFLSRKPLHKNSVRLTPCDL